MIIYSTSYNKYKIFYYYEKQWNLIYILIDNQQFQNHNYLSSNVCENDKKALSNRKVSFFNLIHLLSIEVLIFKLLFCKT